MLTALYLSDIFSTPDDAFAVRIAPPSFSHQQIIEEPSEKIRLPLEETFSCAVRSSLGFSTDNNESTVTIITPPLSLSQVDEDHLQK